jgi:hypothetical protein
MIHNAKRQVMVITLLFCFSHVFSQNVNVNSRLDSSSVLIGEHVELFLQLSHPDSYQTTWTNIPDSIGKVEILSATKIDTVIKDGIITKSQVLTLTAFDSGFYVIPPFVFSYKSKSDTAQMQAMTEALLLEVNTVEVDTTKAIKDIKDLKRIPFGWQDALPYIYILLLISLIGYLIFLFVKRSKGKVKKPLTAPIIPAHEIALQQLGELEESKLWQQGFIKKYHSKISDIIRIFIANRWNIHAMELTTDEIMNLQVIANQDSTIKEALHSVLLLADLAKFAKVIPVQDENEKSLSVSYDFVRANIPVTITTMQKKEVTD